MSEERRKVLDMLAAGTISADDAERLLERLAGGKGEAGTPGSAEQARSSDETQGFVLVRGEDDEPERRPMKHRLKFLRIVVNGSDEEKVNIRIPLAFVRTGLKLSTVLPPKAQDRLLARGIDLSSLRGLEGDDLMEALRDLRVDVDGKDGETVRIFCV